MARYTEARRRQSKAYGEQQGFRLFDIARIPESVEPMDPEHISNWRENGGQTFIP